ncbi:tpaF [Sphaerisporangium fuscum]|uniref:tpaF n=1 Tax=Sphaerisporangium fuscum TaxID=2835868 RepID=UPI002029A846|nr:tpaF [Sphaerisporangium fuscum]
MRFQQSEMTRVLEGLSARGSTADGRAAERHRRDPGSGPLGAIPAAPESRAGRDLLQTLTGRHSSLTYSTRPVPTAEVFAMLHAALLGDVEDWRLDALAGPLDVFVIVLRGEHDDTGVHHVTPSGVRRVATSRQVDPGRLSVQRELADASGLVTVCASLDQADTWAGSHGYRVMVVRAAMMAYDFHLRCQSRGLTGTTLGGFIVASVKHLIEADGVTRQPLFSCTYAYPRHDRD